MQKSQETQMSVAIVQLHVCSGAAACAVAVTCSASEALSLSRLPKLAKPASRLASLAAARELLMPLSLLQIVGTGSFK